ncbi:hypothetical protein PHMEG_00020743 [Phytophthora megakarya]|uniref:Uncharacterized protein n=1 Tax=Phytophthora megakarya TaxID=4795 RepID=A0A225VN15_9STRA|nr:hypothetical protein PHMEG_00020743 [Phytophthora megakarya]
MAPPSATSLPSTAQLAPAPSGVATLAGADGSGGSNPDAGVPDSQGGNDSVPSADLVPHSRSPSHRNPVDSDADEPMQEDKTKDIVDTGASLDITARIVSRFRASTHRHPLSLPPQRRTAMVPEVVPASFPQSAVHQPSDHTFFVGIPAWSQHLADDKYTRDGYAGLEVVQCVDGLTAVDLQDLTTLVDQGGDVDALTLRLREDRPLDLAELEGMLNSTLIRREFASILSHYSPDGLAQKVFASTTFLKRLLAKFRQLRTQVDPSNDTAVQNMLDAQGETTRVRADYATLHEFYWGEARRLQEQLDAAHHRRQSDLRGGLAEHELETRALREEVGELCSQVENLTPGSRPFWVNDNWKRLQDLLERFRDGIAPEKSWSTLIAITAVDDPFFDQGDGAQGKSAQGDKNNEVDLTHQDSGASEPSSRKTTPTKRKGSRGSSRKVPDQPQLRPSGWAPSADQARSPSNQLMFLESDVQEIMKNEPVVWDTLRPDVILLMRAGIGYQGSIAMLNGDVMTHNLFPPSELADMLASMMFWNRLDESFWTKYVPEKYYLRAELRLDLLHSEGVRPGYWPDLVDADVRVAQEVMDDGSSEHDDTQHDANYNPDDDVDNQDDDEIQGGDSVPSAPKRRRTSISSHSDAPATQSTATPPKRARSGSLRRQSPLAQVDSGSLTVADTEIVEVPGPGINFILVSLWDSDDFRSIINSRGFPDYAPNKAGGIQPLKQRFNLADVQALLATEPWTTMFENRVKRLVLHSYSALTPHARMALDKYIRFMKENASGLWHARTQATVGCLGTDCGDQATRYVAEGVPSTIFWEAAYWSLPSKPCYWILMNPRSTNSQGNPYSLAEQLDILDRREPARVQWRHRKQ